MNFLVSPIPIANHHKINISAGYNSQVRNEMCCLHCMCTAVTATYETIYFKPSYA